MASKHLEDAISILAEILDCSPSTITADDTIETLKRWDSLNHMRMILLIEERYKTQLDPDDALSLFTVKDISEYLSKI